MAVLKKRERKEEPEVYLVSEVAKKMRLSPAAIYAKARRGEIPGFRKNGTTVRINRKEFDEWFYHKETI